MNSKEDKILELFFNEGSKHWHFGDIVQEARISQDRANFWLKKLIKDKMILYIKQNGKMPHYIANFGHPNYICKKKLYALEKFYESGFLSHLNSLNEIDTIVLFGSFSRSDWHAQSDIDLFIIGNDKNFNLKKYETILKRDIQLFSFKNKDEVKKTNSHLINNILNGYFIKGSVQNIIEVPKNA